jgi:DNA-binding transcriptional regulator GbsR (MarR family)
MKVKAAGLSPLLKSDTQGLILADLFMNPDELFAITQLAEFAGASLPTAMREVDRLLDAQVVIQKTFGRARLIQANKEHLLSMPSHRS